MFPFIVHDAAKGHYYRGLRKYDEDPVWLGETLRSFQDDYAARFLPLVPHIGHALFQGYDTAEDSR